MKDTPTMKPKILHLIDTYYIGGAGKVLLQFLKNTACRPITSVVSTFSYKNPPSTEFIDAVKKLGYPVALLPQSFSLDPSPLSHIRKIIAKENITIIETHGYKADFAAWWITRFLPIPWIAVSHGWTNENLKIRLYNLLDRWLLKRATCVVGVSPQLTDEIRLLRGKKRRTKMVLNAIDPDFIRYEGKEKTITSTYRKNKETLLLGVFGRLSPEKGHDILIRACRQILKENNAVLLIVGDGPERSTLENLCVELELEQYVFFTGQQAAMGDYYKAIDLLVIPSLSEGLPFVMLEAMSLQKPVLATAVGAIDRVITDGENGWLVEPGNQDAIKEKIKELTDNRELLTTTGIEAKSSLNPYFLITRQCDEMITLYQDILEKDAAERQHFSPVREKEADE